MKRIKTLTLIVISSFFLNSCFGIFNPRYDQKTIFFSVLNGTNDSTCSDLYNPRELKFTMKNLDNDTLALLSETLPLEGLSLNYIISSKDMLEITFYEVDSNVPLEQKVIKFNLVTNDPVRTIKYCENTGIELNDF